jgi:hypothetical protein
MSFVRAPSYMQKNKVTLAVTGVGDQPMSDLPSGVESSRLRYSEQRATTAAAQRS